MARSSQRFLLASCFLVAAAACRPRAFNDSSVKDSWKAGSDNDPAFFEKYGKLDYNFANLKALEKGYLDNQPWSDTYWPNAEGGIAVRWRYADPKDRFGNKSPFTPEEIDKMSAKEINMLSPAEKYDIVSGGYRKGWPMWKRESLMTSGCPVGVGVSESRLPIRILPGGIESGDWEGKCHAWTPAALHFSEPGVADIEATRANGEKFLVHFGSSDIKALLIVGYDMYLNQYPDYSRAGTRCSRNYTNLGQGSSSPCLDTNAGTFFVLVTNLVQKGKPGFVIDVDPGTQVWNQPVWGYSHKIVEGTCPIAIKNPAKASEKVAYVETELAWIGEIEATEAPHGDRNRVEISKFKYCVEMDENNNVIGGAWVEKLRPDFIWMTSKPKFSKNVIDTRTNTEFDLELVNSIYEQSRRVIPTVK
jgi:hypothetical protein